MTALTPADKERQRFARSRAGQIRNGMRTYIETLGVIAIAYREQDHLTLGYDSWSGYLDTEFNHERLQLDPEMRDKAITELRLGGLTQRAIATTLGVGRQTVADHEHQVALPRPPEPKVGLDGKAVSPARSPLVEALTGAIEAAAERNETAGLAGPAPDVEQASNASGTAAADDRVDSSTTSPDHPGTSSGGPGEGAGSAPAPAAGGTASTTPPAAPTHDHRMPHADPEREKQRTEARDRDAGREYARTLVPATQTAVTMIGIATKLGEPNLVTPDMVDRCREAIDVLEAILKGDL